MSKSHAKWQRLLREPKGMRMKARPDQLFPVSGPVELRLQPYGRQGFHEYRIVAISPQVDVVSGSPFEILGYFDPYARKDLHSPETPQAYDRMMFRKCLLNFDRVKWWMIKGATVSKECQAVLAQAGLMPPVFDVYGSKHADRFDWGSKDDLYDYWLKTKPTAAEAISEERYQYYDGVPGQPTPSGQFDSERESARTAIYNRLQTPSGIREHLLGTTEQRGLYRWRGPMASLPRSRFIQNSGPDNIFGAGWS